jgi:hypothetical protein
MKLKLITLHAKYRTQPIAAMMDFLAAEMANDAAPEE